MTGAQRARLMIRLAEIVERDISELAKVETRDNGKLIRDAEAQVAQLPQWLRYFAGLADKINGEAISDAHPNFFVYTRREPIGVVAGILPWNAPLVLMMFKLAPALAAGCTFIAKPSEFTPASTLEFAKRVDEAGFPPGVFNVLSSSARETGASLVAHEGINKVAFTGSTKTGGEIMRLCSDPIKRVTLELGGKSPNLIFADANLDDAIPSSVWSIYYAAGQSCEARSRVLVEASVYDEVVARFAEYAQQIKVGDPLDPETQMGSLISTAHRDRVHGFVKQGIEEGAVVVTGGGPGDGKGAFYRPTVLAHVDNGMTVAQEEIFGPVVTIMGFGDEKDAIEIANDVRYGLFATVWTGDPARGHRVARAIKSGMVGINMPYTAFPGIPFGGYKQSGFGRELSIDTLDLYLETKGVLFSTSPKPFNPFGL